MEKEKIVKIKKERIARLNRSIKVFEEDIEELKEQIEMLEEMIPRENLNDFYREFCRLPREERTNTKIAQMLKEKDTCLERE